MWSCSGAAAAWRVPRTLRFSGAGPEPCTLFARALAGGLQPCWGLTCARVRAFIHAPMLAASAGNNHGGASSAGSSPAAGAWEGGPDSWAGVWRSLGAAAWHPLQFCVCSSCGLTRNVTRRSCQGGPNMTTQGELQRCQRTGVPAAFCFAWRRDQLARENT